jgi:uncharacterized protein
LPPADRPEGSSTTRQRGSLGDPLATAFIVGVLSDTHGHLYPRVARLLEGVDHIIHAGDVGSRDVLEALRSIAPVLAVRGNCDLEIWADFLPARAEVELEGVRIVVGHITPRAEIARLETGSGRNPIVFVSGHSHIASFEQRGNLLYLNPGSAGPRRFGRPRTIAQLEISAPSEREPGGSPRVTAQILSAEDE